MAFEHFVKLFNGINYSVTLSAYGNSEEIETPSGSAWIWKRSLPEFWKIALIYSMNSDATIMDIKSLN